MDASDLLPVLRDFFKESKTPADLAPFIRDAWYDANKTMQITLDEFKDKGDTELSRMLGSHREL